jgi:hypothetical protein
MAMKQSISNEEKTEAPINEQARAPIVNCLERKAELPSAAFIRFQDSKSALPWKIVVAENLRDKG